MPDLDDLTRRIQHLEDIEAIKQLKYRYWRHLDLKQWDELAELFIPEATVCYSSGQYEFNGVEQIMRPALDCRTLFTTTSVSRPIDVPPSSQTTIVPSSR